MTGDRSHQSARDPSRSLVIVINWLIRNISATLSEASLAKELIGSHISYLCPRLKKADMRVLDASWYMPNTGKLVLSPDDTFVNSC